MLAFHTPPNLAIRPGIHAGRGYAVDATYGAEWEPSSALTWIRLARSVGVGSPDSCFIHFAGRRNLPTT